MDREGFKEFVEKQTTSIAKIQNYMVLIDQFAYTIKTFFEIEDIDNITPQILVEYGNWLERENVTKMAQNRLAKVISSYYKYIQKFELERIAKNKFT